MRESEECQEDEVHRRLASNGLAACQSNHCNEQNDESHPEELAMTSNPVIRRLVIDKHRDESERHTQLGGQYRVDFLDESLANGLIVEFESFCIGVFRVFN